MKRTDSPVDLTLYAALFKDIAAWDCGLQPSLDRDLLRLEKIVTTRGLSFVMIDLPDAGRVVDRGLSRGYLDSSNLPATMGKVKSKSSREFLGALFRKVFDDSGRLRADVDTTSIFFLRQVLYLMKKVRKECSDAAIQAEVEEFRQTDSFLRSPSFDWDCDEPRFGEDRLSFTDSHRRFPDLISDRDECPRLLLAILDQVCGRVILFPELDWELVEPRHGPGAVADAKSGTDKYLFPSWPRKLGLEFPFEYFGAHREDLHLEYDHPVPSLNEPPSRLLAVPKTLKGPRMIASEPIAHQYLQLALMKWMRVNLPRPLRSCIDFLDQEPSRALCLEASRTGDLATVDLSAASDRLSCWVVERAFQASLPLLRALHATRTRWLCNATGVGDPFFIKLKKFAPMGSGVTFPVQSIVYCCMAMAAILFESGEKVSSRSIEKAGRQLRVFGDDIIMPSSAVHSLALLMTHCGLKVNVGKTHWQGRFRESCGIDAFGGECVTPLYLRDLGLRETADGLSSWIDVCNNAYSKGLWSLSEVLVQQIPSKIRDLIPVTDRNLGCLTLRTFQPSPPAGKLRFNSKLQREEILGLQSVARVGRGQRENHQSLLQYFLEKPNPETNWSAGWLMQIRLRLSKRWVPTT